MLPHSRNIRFLRALGLCVFTLQAFAFSPAAHASTTEPGVSHPLAIARATRLSNLRYALTFQLSQTAPDIPGTERITFNNTGTGDLALDFRDGTISSATLNASPIPVAEENGHLTLSASALRQGPNELRLAFTAHSAPAGKAITRYHDRDDNSDYLYTLFVPMDASMAFPCFDQPDLKARFTLSVSMPPNWKVISNTSVAGGTCCGILPGIMTVSFAETLPISTYLFAFAAGPFARIDPAAPGQPALYVRKSQLARAQTEAPQVQQTAARGIAYLADYFAQPFPFPKYDLVLIPGFPFGGMEHAGATFLNEDGVLFRTAPTAADRFRRDILVLHETCHQWFGDLVTMRWFDDLWLKEGFAQYMAYKALDALEPAQLPWKHFYEDMKPLAYAIDETEGTTPISQNIPNLLDAKSAYGAIVYQKAPAVLKQLNFFLGEQNFRDGLRLYLKQHAYANAQWSDLVDAFQSARNQHGPPRDVQAWARAWILQRGMPEVETRWSCSANNTMTELTLHQQDVLRAGSVWPISTELLLVFGNAPSEVIRVNWNRNNVLLNQYAGKPCPKYLFANSGDQAYGRFLLDPISEKAVAESILKPDAKTLDPLLRTQLWGALWDNVHVSQSAPSRYIDIALQSMPDETDESLARINGSRIATALHAYLPEKSRNAYVPRAESIVAEQMLHAPTLNLRIVNFRTFTSIAETPAALAQLKALLDGSLSIEGMPLKPLDRWNLIGHLLAMHDPEAPALFAAERARDHSGEAQKYAYAAEAGTPDPAIKARYFDQYLHTSEVQEDWLSQSLRPFNRWNQFALTLPYLTQALDALPQIKRTRKIFFLGAWLSAFLEGQHTPEAQTAVHAWLAAHPTLDPDLRLKVLEASDALDRTVGIRQRFPE